MSIETLLMLGALACAGHDVPSTGPVRDAARGRVTVVLDSATLAVGSSTRARALVATPDDEWIEAMAPVRWRIVRGAGLVTLDSMGTLAALATGRAYISGFVQGSADTVPVTVVPRPRDDSTGVPSDTTTPPDTLPINPSLPVPPDTTEVPSDTTGAPPDTAGVPVDSGGGQPGRSRPERPRVLLDFAYPEKTGRTIVVSSGGNLQAALNTAQRGDEIVLAAGATFTGNFVLPAKSGTAANGWIVVRSDKLAQLPPPGTRVTAAQAALMPKIVTSNVSAAVKAAPGASGWWLAGLEVTVAPALTMQQYGIVVLGEFGAAQSTLASVPSDLVLDRMYIHGQTTTNTSRCVSLNSARTQITDSYIVECHGRGFDAQAIGGANGPGPYKIVNNSLQGSGENLMFGGDDPGIPGLVPSDIEIRRNHLYTPLAWKGVWTKKNLFELKNAVRVLVEENVFDGSWMDGQTGWAVILKSENQSGACTWCRTTDVTFQRNWIRNAGAGIGVAPAGPWAPVDSAPRRILIRENVLENIGVGEFTGDKRGFQLLPGTTYITLERNVLSGSLNAALALEGGAPGVFRDNVWAYGLYGVIGSDRSPGNATITFYSPGAVWTNMIFVGAQQPNYPTGTSFVGTESAAPLAAQIRGLVSAATTGVVIP